MGKSSQRPTQVVKPVNKPTTKANTGQHDRERERQVRGGVTTEIKKS